MSKIKNAIDEILNCEMCYGKGYEAFSYGDEYDFEYCVCNPHNLILDEGVLV